MGASSSSPCKLVMFPLLFVEPDVMAKPKSSFPVSLLAASFGGHPFCNLAPLTLCVAAVAGETSSSLSPQPLVSLADNSIFC